MAVVLGHESLEERWNACKVQEEQKASLIEDLFKHIETLSHKLSEAEQSLDEKKVFIKSVKQDNVDMVKQIVDLKAERDKHCYALVVIDGDGMPFLDELVVGGVEGGQKTVGLLKQAVLETLRSSDPNLPHHLKVVVRVYANLRGLAKAYADTGALGDRDDLDQFVRGFNMGDQLCDFVDAGNGKECADEKVKGCFQFGLDDVHCRHVLFGGSTDNGYARLLGSHTTVHANRERIVLVEGPPFAQELADLKEKFSIVSFDNVFRTQKLPNIKRRVSFRLTPPSTPSVGYAAAAARAPAAPLSSSSHAGQQHSGTTIASAAAGVSRNKAGQRVDAPLGCNQREIVTIKNRKLCNNFHLLGWCSYLEDHGSCLHEHGTRVTGRNLQALRAVARLSPCYAGLDCNDPSCILGHRCPRENCAVNDCKFGTLHNIDTEIVH
ncbi:CCCH zinc finger DNA binding protein [Colletotrichum sojae]|uniref:CCCH zinc finger DNA binding protein n=1 Tax=Colletotrichum sojae TaxID=2175907 RepID=A0A8H6IPZ6_9PEZI|nr:CCCH zinc finger DNA binding protein [Colletotrichum sojae]